MEPSDDPGGLLPPPEPVNHFYASAWFWVLITLTAMFTVFVFLAINGADAGPGGGCGGG